MPLDVGFSDLPLDFDVGFSMMFLVHTAFDHLKRTTYSSRGMDIIGILHE
jgi:hypothetical protein